MSDSGNSGGPTYFDPATSNWHDLPEAKTGWEGIINPDYENGPVFTDEHLAAMRNSPEMVALGMDLTQPPPNHLAGMGLAPDYVGWDFTQHAAVDGTLAAPGNRAAPVGIGAALPIVAGVNLAPASTGNSSANPSSVQNKSAGSGGADQAISATPPDALQTADPMVQSSWSSDERNRRLLDGTKSDPPPSLGGFNAGAPIPAEVPNIAQTTGQGGVVVKAPDPQSFAPAVQGLRDSIANAPLPVLHTRSNAQALLGAIKNGEGYADADGNNADYNALAGKAKGRSGQNFTGMTLRQAMDWQQKNSWSDPKGQTQTPAIGAYQFKRGTLADAARALDLDLDKTKLDPSTQDALAMQLIKNRQKRATSNGHLDEDAFQKQLSMEWASLPSDKEGYSYYAKKPEDRMPEHKTRVTHQAVRDGMSAYLD